LWVCVVRGLVAGCRDCPTCMRPAVLSAYFVHRTVLCRFCSEEMDDKKLLLTFFFAFRFLTQRQTRTCISSLRRSPPGSHGELAGAEVFGQMFVVRAGRPQRPGGGQLARRRRQHPCVRLFHPSSKAKRQRLKEAPGKICHFRRGGSASKSAVVSEDGPHPRVKEVFRWFFRYVLEYRSPAAQTSSRQ
jgi:hypothetical protein